MLEGTLECFSNWGSAPAKNKRKSSYRGGSSMLRRFTTLVTLVGVLGVSSFAQGLSTNASKDDWEEINFEFNSGVLSDGYPSLLRLADLLHQHAGYHVKVESNTDNLGSDKHNEKLGLERANTVKDFLVKYGASGSHIEFTTGGKTDPK